MREMVEGVGEDEEEGRGHDEAVAAHGEIVVDAVEEEVEGDGDAVVRQADQTYFLEPSVASEALSTGRSTTCGS